MPALNKEALLAAGSRLKRETIMLPEGAVNVQEMTGGDRDQYEMFIFEKGKEEAPKDYMRALITVFSVVDDAGNKLFSLDDVPQISKLGASLLDRIYDAAIRLSAIGGQQKDDAVKNSESATSGAVS